MLSSQSDDKVSAWSDSYSMSGQCNSQVCSETEQRLISNQGNIFKNIDSLIEQSITLIEQSSHVTERMGNIPRRLCCKCKLLIILSSCCPLNTKRFNT